MSRIMSVVSKRSGVVSWVNRQGWGKTEGAARRLGSFLGRRNHTYRSEDSIMLWRVWLKAGLWENTAAIFSGLN